jgi:hypothetical protein
MIQVKLSTDAWVPVRFLDSWGLPMTGITYTSVTATVNKWGSTSTGFDATPASASDFFEVTAGAFANLGHYKLKLPAALLNVPGGLTLAAASSVVGVAGYLGEIDVVSNIASDIYDRLGPPQGPYIAADILQAVTFASSASVDTAAIRAKTVNLPSDPADQSIILSAINNIDLGDIELYLYEILQCHINRRKKFSTGPNANKTIVYDDDGTTPLFTFAMKDEAGEPEFQQPR